MPSEKGLHRWIILAVVLVWGVLIGLLWGQTRWAQVGSLADALHHVPRTTLLLVSVSLGVVCFGAFSLTRLGYCALRERRPRRNQPLASTH